MKKKLIVAISIIAVFAFSIAALAYTRGSGTPTAASCCSGDSCPMKGKKAEGAKHASCCDDCDCCKEGNSKAESCPMKKHGKKNADMKVSADHTSHNVVVATGEACCGCSCCGGEKKKSSTDAV